MKKEKYSSFFDTNGTEDHYKLTNPDHNFSLSEPTLRKTASLLKS